MWAQSVQSAENRKKERNKFWLRLHHTVILISNGRTSASKKMNLMALTRTLRFLLLHSKERGKNSTVFGRLCRVAFVAFLNLTNHICPE